MYITLEDFRDIAIGASLLMTAAFISIALYRLSKLLAKANELMEENRKDIRNAVSELPATISGLKQAVSDVKGITGKADALISEVESAVAGLTSSVKGASEGISDTVKAVGGVIGGISSLFSVRREKVKKKEE